MEKGVPGDEGPVRSYRDVEQGVSLSRSQERELMRRVKTGQFSTTGARAVRKPSKRGLSESRQRGLSWAANKVLLLKNSFFTYLVAPSLNCGLWTPGCGVWDLIFREGTLCAKSLQACPTLCDPTDCSPPGSDHGVLQARILEWVAVPSSREASQPTDQTSLSSISCIGRRVLYHQCHLWSGIKTRPPHWEHHWTTWEVPRFCFLIWVLGSWVCAVTEIY